MFYIDFLGGNKRCCSKCPVDADLVWPMEVNMHRLYVSPWKDTHGMGPLYEIPR